MNILDTIAEYSMLRVKTDKRAIPQERLREKAELMKGRDHRFLDALRKPGLSFICEIKKASPSKGIISESFPYLDIAKEYENAGADCVSCLTEPKWFKGSDNIFRQVRARIDTPMIRKDFTVDEYQIYQAKCMEADAVLLICSILDDARLKDYLSLCKEIGLDALVEAHNEKEIESAVKADARIIGVNNRNLKDFSVDFSNALKLRSMIPKDTVYVAESGVKNADDAKRIKEAGTDAVLIGEAFMRAYDKAALLREMRNA
ncbi:MAG: indole-3-glycerol phosphate synthase TrpC [Lachnospiraceae bacterium]|nr:indole-3-glycerol phosphate synthase TrpC [Lachnospiraceae bacterium]MDY6220942.1 indole-3-glycerol phosphate synthase TrpC [Candidatus Alectryocaccobium sp.]